MMQAITVFIAFIAATIGGSTLLAMVISARRRKYDFPLWVKAVIGAAILAMFGIAIGYVDLFMAAMVTENEAFIWLPFALRMLASTMYIAVPAITWYAFRQMEEAQGRAEDAARQLEVFRLFQQNTSHELRTPLTIIKGFAEMMTLVGDVPDQYAEYAGFIHHQATNMYELVENILVLEKARIGSREYMHLVNLSKLLDEVVEFISRATASKRGIDLRLAPCPDAPDIFITGDELQLELMVNNLLTNAVKFARAEGGIVRVEMQRQGQTAVIRFVDNGIGIDPAFIPRLFEPYSQQDGSATRKYRGVGIGLHVVKTIVEAHNGRITATSQPGHGTTFEVVLPIGG